jgi:H+/Cl- antiporter ClcA
MADQRADAAPAAEDETGISPYLHVVGVSLVAAVAVLAWLWVFAEGTKLLWQNDFVASNPWMFPVICLPFSLLVGLLVRYRNAPTTLNESLLTSLSGDVAKIEPRTLPVNVLMAWASLFSGAVLGPEGGIGGISSRVAVLYADVFRIPAALRRRIVFSAIGAAYNGLVASPLFTGVLATEVMPDPATRAATLPANLIGGAIGFLVFSAFGLTGLQDYLHLAQPESLGPLDVVAAAGAGILGLVLAAIAAALFAASARFFGRFSDRVVLRALIAGAVFSVAGMLAPILMFSGEHQLTVIVSGAAGYGTAVLLVMALAKLSLLAVSFKSGFLGGPVFPSIFASVCIAEAVSLLLPGVNVDVLIGGVMAGLLVALFRAPFMVILLAVVMLAANADLTAMIVVAVAAVLIVQPVLQRAVNARRAVGSGAAAGTVA